MHGSEVHTAEEFRLLFEQSKESGEIEDSEHEMIENVFQFTDRMVKQIMVPRTKRNGPFAGNVFRKNYGAHFIRRLYPHAGLQRNHR